MAKTMWLTVAERVHGFESFRRGTLSLYAAFNTKTGSRKPGAEVDPMADSIATDAQTRTAIGPQRPRLPKGGT
jgi:hypothetical protein